ncbi:MAG: hypothetical protein ACKOC8_10135 [Pirellulales bacterium]
MRTAFLASSALVLSLAASFAPAAEPASEPASESASEASTRSLIEGLEERQMPDVMLWVVERAEKNPATSQTLKAELPFLKATALVAASRTESDSAKRAAMLDEAEKAIDAFLATKPAGSLAIAAYSQKANLLVERGRGKVELAKRPGQDPEKLGPEAVAFFDSALETLKSTLPADHQGEITDVTNAEDAVRRELRRVDAEIAKVKEEAKAAAKDEAPKLSPAQKVVMEKLEAEQEALRAKLLSARLMTAGVYFEKSRAYAAGSKEANAALVESTNLFEALAEKYASKGAGMFARYYCGRNEVLLGKHEAAVETLTPVVLIDGRSPLAIGLKAKGVNTTLEALLALAAAEKDAAKLSDLYAKLDDDIRKFALTPAEKLPGRRLDAEWLALKYRAATLLERKAASLDAKEKTLRTTLLRDAKKLATEVTAANKDFAKEARELAAKLGKDLPAGSEEKDFATLCADAKLAFTAMQEKQARAKQLVAEGKASEAAEVVEQSAPDRDTAIKLFQEALALPTNGETDEAALNSARSLLTFLFYDAKRFAEAGDLGRLLTEKYPNAPGSRQAAKVALASLQSLAQQRDAAVAKPAREKLLDFAALMAKTWPAEAEAGDALTVMLNAGIEARSGEQIVALIEKVPAESPRRADLLMRAGTALRREVQDARKPDATTKTPAETIARWDALAKSSLDEGLNAMDAAAALPPGSAAKVAVSAALTRAQMALADDELDTADKLLTNKVYGPWIVATTSEDPALAQGSLAESSLTVALQYFIEAQKFDDAQEAMAALEKAAGQGEAASAKLTAMYLSMGRNLQERLEQLGSGDKAGSPEIREQASRILGGFEKFLESIANRDKKTSSQIWVATTYLMLGSGKGTGAIVAKSKAEQYLDRAADTYAGLLERKDEAGVPDAERQDLERFEPSIRRKLVSLFKERGKWDEAQEQMNWLLADAKRQNSLDIQIEAAELLQAAGIAAKDAKDDTKADGLLREAAAGRKTPPTVIWGWGGIANKLSRQAFASTDDKALKAREQFFDARLRVAESFLLRAELPGVAADRDKRLETAKNAVVMTRKLYPDLGGDASQQRFEKILKQIQKAQGAANPGGFKQLDEEAAAASPPAAAAG